ncbi:MAG TPA: zinc ABC transporter substrate-binding protein [Acidimicrobiia bacterium]|jgi:zinc/manganese transport system substrate-binding protein
MNSQTRVIGRANRRVAVVLAAGMFVLAACGSSSTSSRGATGSSGGSGKVVQVVAAENFWGSIAEQIGGTHAHVVSIITNPDTDPHDYEPTAGDARTLATAQLVIENGIGYDSWTTKFVAADPNKPTVLNVGDLVGVADGGNPHRWYNPTDTQKVTAQIVKDLQTLDPTDSAYFSAQQSKFNTTGLADYHAALEAIKTKYAGTKVGASESIFSMLAPALGLDLITPYSFLKAISEGTDVSAADKQTIDNQIKHHEIKIYVYNSQNVTPDVQTQLAQVKAEKIPYATITETLTPASASYQQWQTSQLRGIQAALAQATGH